MANSEGSSTFMICGERRWCKEFGSRRNTNIGNALMLTFLRVAATVLLAASVPVIGAKRKTEDLRLQLLSAEGCSREFFGEQEQDASLRNVEVIKHHHVVGYRRGATFIKQFPDEITVTVYSRRPYYWPMPPEHPTTCKSFDAGRVKFSASWRNESRTLPTSGKLLKAQWHPPQAMRELLHRLLDLQPACRIQRGSAER